jgi:hypothetical protein
MQENQEKPKKNRRKKKFLLFLLILLLIYIIMTRMTISYSVDRDVVLKKNITTLQTNEVVNETCDEFEYEYAYRWISWEVDERAGTMTPTIDILNHMNRPGIFKVKFAYIRNVSYPWEIYNTSIDKTTVAIWSKEQEVTIPAGKNVIVMTLTEMPELGQSYWTYAYITPPRYRYCTKNEKAIISQNITYKDEIVKKKEIQTAPLFTYLNWWTCSRIKIFWCDNSYS